jgi:hemerythrin-like domain-containing protein
MSARVNVPDRRRFFRWTAGGAMVAAALPVPVLGAPSPGETKSDKPEGEEDVAAAEDLMREHGVLRRLMIVCDEIQRRIHDAQELQASLVHDAARLVRRFVEDYHERLEEDLVFPRLKKEARLAPVIAVLLNQHSVGRTLTAQIDTLATDAELKSAENRSRLAKLLSQFNRMFGPHTAWEDTVIFPALHALPAAEYAKLGDLFEDRETQILGKQGYERALDDVIKLEKSLDIHDLARFTATIG